MKVAVFEDNDDIARWYQAVLEDAGHLFTRADRLDLSSVDDADVAIVDLMMPDVDGEQILEWLAANKPDCRRVVATARWHPTRRVSELAHQILTKAFTYQQLLDALR